MRIDILNSPHRTIGEDDHSSIRTTRDRSDGIDILDDTEHESIACSCVDGVSGYDE